MERRAWSNCPSSLTPPRAVKLEPRDAAEEVAMERKTIGAQFRDVFLRAFRLGPAVVGDANAATFTLGSGYGQEANAIPSDRWLELSVAVHACVRLRAQALASVPVVVYRRTAEGLVAVPDHPLAELLRFVNPHWTGNRLWQMTESSLGVWGQAFWVLERGRSGKDTPSEIWYARGDKMKPIPDQAGYLSGFRYEDGKRGMNFTPGEVIWFRYPNPADEFRGLSPLEAARVSVETSVDAMRANASIFRNGMSPGGILSPEDSSVSFTREERELLEAQLSRRLSGADRRHRMMVFSHRVNLSTPTLSPKDAEFLSLMGWTLNDVCRVFQVPPMKVQDFSRATFSNVEQADKALWTDAIIPELSMLAAELTEQLAPMFGDDLEVQFDTSGIRALQEDMTEITDQMGKLAAMGVPLNRLLQVYRPDLLPPDGAGWPWGDEPMNLQIPGFVQAAPAGQEEAAQVEPVQVQEAAVVDGLKAAGNEVAIPFSLSAVPSFGSTRHKAELRSRDALTRPIENGMAAAYLDWAGRLTADIVERMGATRKAEGDPTGDVDPEDPFDREEWAAAAAEEMGPFVRDAVERGGNVTASRLGAGVRFNIRSPQAERFLRERTQRFVEEITETRWRDLKASLQQGIAAGEDILALAARVPAHVRPQRSASETIARTEVIGAFNGGTEIAFRQSGKVARKAWLAAIDERTRETHEAMHGQVVDLDEDFQSPDGASGPAPGQLGEAAEDINCRCTLIAVLGAAAGDREGDFAGVEAERAEEEF